VTSVIEVQSASTDLFAGTWCPLVSVITTLYYVVIVFHRQVWYRVFLCAMRVLKVRASSSSPRLLLCQILFLSRHPLLS